MQLRSPNLTYKCFTQSPRKLELVYFEIKKSKVKVSPKSSNGVDVCTLVSVGFY